MSGQDGRIVAARQALTASSHAVMSGGLGYDAETVIAALAEAVEGLLGLLDEHEREHQTGRGNP
jgi:hypothetical protein